MSTFSPTCTLPESTVNYISSPNIRGSLSILWSCLSILLLCTWAVQHLNIPFKRNPPTKMASFLQGIRMVGRKPVWMLVNLIFPEWMLGKAVLDLVSARYSHKTMSAYAEKDGREWTLTHSFFANLGGFAIVFTDQTAVVQETGQSKGQDNERQDSTTHSSSEEEKNPTSPEYLDFLSGEVPLKHQHLPHDRRFLLRLASSSDHTLWRPNAKNYRLVNQALTKASTTVISSRFNDCCRNLTRLQGNIWVLDAAQLAKAREFGIIDAVPDITKEQIENQTKGDAVVKTLAVGQSIWMIIQVIARRATGLNSSQLEIMTMAFSVVAFMTYLCLWYKPQDIACVTPVHASRYPSTQELLEIGLVGPESFFRTVRSPYIASHALPQFGSTTGTMSRATVSLVGGVGGAIFGAIHCAAWSFQFPTTQERLLWRIASVVACAIPTVTSCALFRGWYTIYLALVKQKLPPAMKDENKSGNLLDMLTMSTKNRPRLFSFLMDIYGTIIMTGIVVYTASRLYLIVESFRSLCFLPPDAFLTVNWSISLPHVG